MEKVDMTLCHNLCELHVGDALEVLRTLPDESVNCCVTSPPYWCLRNYGVEGEYGSEPTIAAYVENMVQVFREVRRVLRKDGTCWLNLGDTYAGSWGAQGGPSNLTVPPSGVYSEKSATRNPKLFGLKPKDRCMIPARVAIALQADGWWLRDEIIWHKPSPMPSSVTDRTTPAHEMIYLLTRSARYWYDAAAIRTAFAEETKRQSFGTMDFARRGDYANGAVSAHGVKPRTKMPDNWDTGPGGHGAFHREGREKGTPVSHKGSTFTNGKTGVTQRERVGQGERHELEGANARSVWSIATEAFKDAHFATFPREIPKRCILAGCPAGGTVLDPFAGSGTTLAVAVELGRKAVGIELSPVYAKMIEKRVNGVTPALEMGV